MQHTLMDTSLRMFLGFIGVTSQLRGSLSLVFFICSALVWSLSYTHQTPMGKRTRKSTQVSASFGVAFRLATTCVDFGRAQIRRQVDTRWSQVICKCAKFTTFCNLRADFWPPIPSPHASSGFANLRRLASPFGQGLRTSSSSWQQKNCHACVFKLCPCSTFYLKSWKRGCTLIETKLGWISQSSLVPLDPSVVSNTPKRKPGQFAYDMGNALVYIYTTLLSLDNVERLGKYV